MKNEKLKFGFTLIETLVAITILSAAVAGPMVLSIKNIGTASVSQDQLVAFYLGQEVFEYARNVRDTNILKESADWLGGLENFKASGSAGCYADVKNNTVTNCGAVSCSNKLKFDGQNYNYTNGEETPFIRTVKIDDTVGDGGDEAKIKNCGFTLIELIVALGVFMMVMTITLSAFLNIMDIQKKTEAFRKVNDNLNFAMEAMMREIREGKGYSAADCSGADFCFTNKDGKAVKYQLNGGGYMERKEEADEWLRMTSDGIKITRLSFFVSGGKTYSSGERQQPLVTISIGGESGEKEKLKSKLDLQATVSQRKLDSQ